MLFRDSEVEIRDCVGVLETDADNAVDHGSPPERGMMLRDIVFRTHLDMLCGALSGDTPARKKPGAVRFHSGAKVVRVKPPHERNRLRWSAAESCPDCRSVVTTSLSSRWPGKGPEEAESTWEPVSRVFNGATAVLRKELKALRLKMDQNRGPVQRYGLRFLSYYGMGGIPNSELLTFGFIEILNMSSFFF